MAAMKTSKALVVLTGIGAFAPLLTLFVGGFVGTTLQALFGLTWLYCVVDTLAQKRWDGSKKVAWIAGIILLQVILVPLYWWMNIREDAKWSKLAGA